MIALALAGFATFKVTSGGTTTGGTTTSVQTNGSIAFVNMDSLYASYDYYTDVMTELKTEVAQAEKKLQKQASRFRC